MSDGEAIIDAVIRASALSGAEQTDDGFIFVWAANAHEQIESALKEAGYKLVKES
jgi:transcriptional/translational regulatory protein YebC/TACO1